jgi:hypothetical protein
VDAVELEGAAEFGALAVAGLGGALATASFGGRGGLPGDFWFCAPAGLVMIIGVWTAAAGGLEGVLA